MLLILSTIPWGSAQEASPDNTTPAEAAAADDIPVYTLPPAEVSATQDSPNLVTREEMERYNAQDLWEAVRQVPGVQLSGGGRRNDSNFTVRGFGSDSVPIIVDDIMVANTYRGEGDAARYLTGDLESIEIQKGYSSPLLGANTLGGAVLLRTAKPRDPVELSLKSSADFDDTGDYNGTTQVLSAGGRGEQFYGNAVFQFRGIDHYRLSAEFEPTLGNPQEEGNRLWSDSTDMKLTALTGWTPQGPWENLDLWLTWLYQDSDKGISPPDVEVLDFSIWDWPLWKRQSLSLHTDFDQGPLSLKFLTYYDKYDNRLDDYWNMTAYEYGIHTAHSDYDEYALGFRLEGGWIFNPEHQVSAALIFKKDDHIGLTGEIQQVHINEDTWSVGAEYRYTPSWLPKLQLRGGLGFDLLNPNEFEGLTNSLMQELGEKYYIVQSRQMLLLNAQAGIFYDITENHQVRFTYARKNRFPTMFQRYSTRFGRQIPNSLLGPETANHVELGYRSFIGNWLTLNGAAYYSRIKGKIVTVQVPNPKSPYWTVDFSRNLDETSLYGLELSGEFRLNEYLSAGLNGALAAYEINHSEAQVTSLPYYPAASGNCYVEIRPGPVLSLLPRLEYLGKRDIDAEGTKTMDAYWLVHFTVTAEFSEHLSMSAGIENLFDTYYEIRQHAPQAGRTYNLACTIKY